MRNHQMRVLEKRKQLVKRHPSLLAAESSRVITRLHIPGDKIRTRALIDRVAALSDGDVHNLLDGVMEDFTAGHISQVEADRLVADLNALFSSKNCRFHAGVSYRNLMVAPAGLKMDVDCTPPHDIPNEPVASHRPRGQGADWLGKRKRPRRRDGVACARAGEIHGKATEPRP